VCAPDLARKLISWEPKVALRDGLARTWEYIKEHILDYKTRIYNV